MGTEFKNLVDTYSGQMIWLELMEGKEIMRNKEFTKEFGVIIACVMRGVKQIEGFETYLEDTLQPKLFLAIRGLVQSRRYAKFGNLVTVVVS